MRTECDRLCPQRRRKEQATDDVSGPMRLRDLRRGPSGLQESPDQLHRQSGMPAPPSSGYPTEDGFSKSFGDPKRTAHPAVNGAAAQTDAIALDGLISERAEHAASNIPLIQGRIVRR